MTKADIVGIVADGTGLTKLETAAVIDQRVNLRGFGNFKVVERKARTARNPRTRELIQIPQRKAPVFKPSKDFKNYIADESK